MSMKSSLILKKGITVAVLTAGLVFSVAAKSEATFTAFICNDAACAGADDISVIDNGAGVNGGVDGSATLGHIILDQAAFGYTVITNNSQSKPVLANGMDLTYTVTRGAAATGDIWLYATDTGFQGPTSVSGSLNGNSDNGFITASLCVNDLATCVSGTDNTPSTIGINLGPLAAGTNPYTLILGVQIHLTTAGTTATGDYRANSGKIPEPASMLLFGLGLAGLGFWGRKRLGK